MTLYLDSSALLKTYLDEPGAEAAAELVEIDGDWTTSRVTRVEVRRVLSRELGGVERDSAREQFELDWANIDVIEADADVCERAAEIADLTGVRTLDALHLGAAQRAGAPRLSLVTFDRRQAEAARSLGWTVLGA